MFDSPLLDSPEGIAMLIAWARDHGFVLNEAHHRLARKHEVDCVGVTFATANPAHLFSFNGMVGSYNGMPVFECKAL